MGARQITFSRDKLEAAVLHVIARCEPDKLGAVKLHKVLYYSDMLSFLETGRPVTGAEYRKRPFGPTCDALLPALENMERYGLISIEKVNYHGFAKKQFAALVEPATNQLNEVEVATLNEMIEFVCHNNTAKTISDFSHDMVWEMVEFGDVIPYHNAINLIPNIASSEAMEWAEIEAAKIADYRSKPAATSAVAGRRARALHERLA